MSDKTAISQVREIIEMYMRSHNLALEDAAIKISATVPQEQIDEAVHSIRLQAQSQQMLKVPSGVTKLDYARLLDDVKGNRWYTGPLEAMDKHWPPLKLAIEKDMGKEVAEAVDDASTKIVSLLSDPGVHGLSKRGLVLGYVQSGKTANYSAVCAKGADAGFRLFIVLSGIHNSLRSQTQVRMDKDLIAHYPDPWVKLTNQEEDFGRVQEGAGLLSARELRNLVVIKKNASRLQRMVDWLESIHENIRRACPVIIIDDEADQATPNSQAARNEVSKINQLTRRIFQLLPTATYIGYTATPFANVLIDPNAEDDLYPGDFIIDLPRPDAYFGSEKLFGREQLGDEEQPVDGYDIIRTIGSEDIGLISDSLGSAVTDVARSNLPASLLEAIGWFVLSVAARWQRGQHKHTSMLVHTSHRVLLHDDMFHLVKSCLNVIAREDVPEHSLEAQWLSETARFPSEQFGRKTPTFEDLSPFINQVFESVKVLIDNGSSHDRLNYETDEPQTVIAVGGQTLSRGLTLEGLTVSYFLRTSRTYDTLLQMGRWFGYRIGYEELPRVWMSREMQGNFRDLATIEQEIRNDIKRYTAENITPMQFGLRIRQHPTMAITAASKMHFADEVRVSYAGSRKQTFRFDNHDHSLQENNIRVTNELVDAISDAGIAFTEKENSRNKKTGKWLAREVPSDLIIRFLEQFDVAEEHGDLQPELTVGYLNSRNDAAAKTWNVAIMGSSMRKLKDHNGVEFETGTMDLGLPAPVVTVNRAPLNNTDERCANIKALMSAPDRYIDLDIPISARSSDAAEETRLLYSNGIGLLLLYPISGRSRPTVKIAPGGRSTRKPFDNPMDMIGMGIVFPDYPGVNGERSTTEHTYVGLPDSMMPPSLDAADDDENEVALLTTDSEGTANVDGSDKLSEIE